MATKISQLTSITKSSYTENDLLLLVNYTEPTGTTVNSTITELKEYINDGVLLSGGTLSATTISGDTLYGDGSNLTNLPSGWIETTIDLTAGDISTIGSSPITLLPAPGVNKYYEYDGELEFTFISTPLTFSFPETLGITLDKSDQKTGTWFYEVGFTRNGVFKFSSDVPTYVRSLGLYQVTRVSAIKLDEPLTLMTWNGTNPTGGDGTIKIKLKYKIKTFG